MNPKDKNSNHFSWWELSIADLEKKLETDIVNGLSAEEVLRRQREYGKNVFQKEKKVSVFFLLYKQIKSPLAAALLAAGAVTVFLEHFLDSIVIGAALCINIVIGVLQEKRAGKAFEALAASREKYASVVRGGERFLVSSESLVPGDVVFLEHGSYVPADARLVEHKELMVNEATLTGEWIDVEKNAEGTQSTEAGKLSTEQPNMVWMGTLISAGHGRVVVVETGERTELGRIAKSLSENIETVTPFQKSVAELVRFLTVIVLTAVLFIFLLGLVRAEPFSEMLLISIAIAVAVMPEGLPIAVTVVLAIGMEAVLKKGGLVKELSAAETLGSTTVILTDKTGTLTEAKMRVEEIVVAETFAADSRGAALASIEASHRDGQDVLDMAILASNAYREGGDKGGEEYVIHGRPVERAVLAAGFVSGVKQELLLEEFPRIDFLPFESKNRFSASLHMRKEHKKMRLIFFGSPELLLGHATLIHRFGKSSPLSDETRKRFEEMQNEKTAAGMRMVGVAYQDTSMQNISEEMGAVIPEGIVFGGLIALHDPVRPDAAASIQKAKDAGARVIMATGDYSGTAESVALAVGIAKKEERALTGGDIESLSDSELRAALLEHSIFARVLPHQKQRIVRILQEQGEVVAMTGDGVNDAPALRKANIGIALGSGTEVAKEASDIILLNDDFSVIVGAIEEGRRILANLKKIVIYLLSTSFSEVFIAGAALLAGSPLPLLPGQILFANIVGEGFMNFAFAFEPPEEGNMRRDPRETSMKHILTTKIRAFLFAIGGVTGVSLLGLYAAALLLAMPIEKVRTVIFAALSLYSILFAFSLKDFHNPLWRMQFFSNKYLLGAFFLSLIILSSALFFAPFRHLLSLVPLSGREIGVIIFIGILNLSVIETTKHFIFRK
ncbi:MAG: HAD-IC family P-type ATPase [Parcubacteria group bacterium]|nr:HAD-IC family P-type ATPase [Parcubacteria group bacterium]